MGLAKLARRNQKIGFLPRERGGRFHADGHDQGDGGAEAGPSGESYFHFCGPMIRAARFSRPPSISASSLSNP